MNGRTTLKMRTSSIVLFILLAVVLGPVILSTGIIGNYGDIYLYYYPQKYLAKECIVNGTIPLWNPYIFAGTPFLANPQTAVFYPISMLFYLFPITQAFNVFYLVHLFLGGLFFMLFILSLKKSKFAALLSGIVFVFSSFIFLRLAAGHPVIMSGYIWLPLVMMLVSSMKTDFSVCKKTFFCGVNENLCESVVLGLALSLCFLSGHSQPFYMTVLVATTFFLFKKIKAIPVLFFAMIIFVMITAVQWLPTMEFVQNSMRYDTNKNSLWDYDVSTSYSLPPKNLLNLVAPNLYGNPQDKTFVHNEKPSEFFEMHSLYFGIIPLVLSMLGFFVAIHRRKYFLPIILGLSLLFSFGSYTPIYKLVQNLLPGLNSLRVPARFYFVFLFAAILLMVKGSDRLFSSLRGLWSRQSQNRHVMIKLFMFLVIFLDLFIWNHKFVFKQDLNQYLSSSAISEFLQLNNNMFRFAGDETTPNQDKSMLHHLYNVNGYDALFLRNFVGYINQTDKEKNVITTVGIQINDYSLPALTSLATRFYMTRKDSLPPAKPLFKSNDVKIYENKKVLPMIFGIDENKHIVFPQKIDFVQPKHVCEMNLKHNAKLFISGIAYPDWNIFVNGKEIKQKYFNSVIKNIELSAGEYLRENKIVMLYQPKTFKIGVILTLIILTIGCMFCFVRIIYTI